MKVVFDAYWWVRGTQSLKNVLHGIIETWSTEWPDDQLVIVARRKHLNSIVSLPSNISVHASRLWPQALLASIAVPLISRRVDADAMLVHNFAPLFGRGRAVFVHDVLFESNPEWFTRKELLYFRWMTRLSRRAHVVFTSSQSEARRIRRFTRSRKVVPVGLGIDPVLVTGIDEREGSGPTLPERYALVVGRLNARKNLEVVLEGARLSETIGPSVPLIVVGRPEGADAISPAWLDDAVRSGSIRFSGFVSVSDLRVLIKNCSVFLCLSLDEGFGLPPVEARALGATVIASDIPVFRETLQDEAIYVSPHNPIAVATAIDLAMSRPKGSATSGVLLRYDWRLTVARIREEISKSG